MSKMTRLLVAAVVVMAMALAVPAFATETKVADTEINLGGGYPLWDTHTDDDSTSFNGGYLIYGSVDKVKKDSKWLSYGLMYNYTRMELEVRKTTTSDGGKFERCRGDICWDEPKPQEVICLSCDDDDFPIWNPETTTTSTNRSWLNVHVLGPYVKPFYKITDNVKVFGMIGFGAMYVDGAVYGDEFGGAGFASAGLSVDIYKNFGIAGQLLYVKGATSNVDDIDYMAPVVSFNYKF